MVNWQSPETQEAEFLAVIKLCHAMSGLYLWEWAINLPFDYQMIQMTGGFKFPPAVYVASRTCALIMVAMNLTVSDITHEINCNAFYRCSVVFGCLATFFASTLIALRAIAIWNRNIYIVIPVATMLAGYFGVTFWTFFLGSDVIWNPEENACATFSNIQDDRWSWLAGLIVDTSNLAIALLGIVFYRRSNGGEFWTTVYRQGIVSIVLVIIFYAIPLVFFWLNLNVSMTLMFQLPSVTATVIAATRMYKSLYEYNLTSSVHVFSPRRPTKVRVTTDQSIAMQSTDRTGSTVIHIQPLSSSRSMDSAASSGLDKDKPEMESLPTSVHDIGRYYNMRLPQNV